MTDTLSTGWQDARNAEAYEAYAQTWPTYRETARDLVARSDIAPGMTVIDLACGTGIVIAELLRHSGTTGRITGVDRSPAMLAVARRKFATPNVTLIAAAAEHVHTVVSVPADRVLCNSAFWQMDIGAVFAALHQVLRDGRQFVFNLPHGFFTPEDAPVPRSGISFDALLRGIATTDFGYTAPTSIRRRPRLDFAAVERAAMEHGFVITAHEVREYPHLATELLAFYHIPVMLASRLPTLTEAHRLAVLERAWERYEKVDGTQRWTYFVATREASIRSTNGISRMEGCER